MATLTCKFCGKQFESKRKDTLFCKGPHYLICPVCSTQFQVDKNLSYYYKHKQTACCSKQCASLLAGSKLTEAQKKQRVLKSQQTMMERYGVVNPGQMPEVLEKRKQTNLAKFGTEYANQCEEIKQKTKQTNMKRYGVPCTFQSAQIKQKAKETIQQRYGVDHISKSEHFKKKLHETSLEKYGVDYHISSKQVRDKCKKTTWEHYGVENPAKCPGVMDKAIETKIERYGTAAPDQEKTRKTNNQKYGHDYYTQTEEYKQKVTETDLAKYGVAHHLQSPEVKAKRTRTVLARYGVDNVSKSEAVKEHIKDVFIQKYGYDSPSKVPDIRRRQIANARCSKLEIRIANMLNSYNIVFDTQHILSDGCVSHTFDFYIPQYKILLDADGVYFHSYLSDPDGKQVREDYDDVRISLVPKDHIFMIAVEGSEDKTVKELHDVIKQMDSGVFDYDTNLFKWCRETGFPYPSYTRERMIKDWNNLCEYRHDTYKPNCRVGISIIRNFHKSIYDCKVGRNSTPVTQAWEDDTMLKKVIENRLIYKNDVDPAKVLSGFNISKICPTVSIFNPVLARYLVNTYLNEFNTVFDPFSGFSGRLLGTVSSGKKYIGQDLNVKAVMESNQIAKFLKIQDRCSISRKDVLQCKDKQYSCLLTCPPYNDKEIYSKETTFKTCDEWIQECIDRFTCKRYVFVVDNTEQFKDNIVMVLQNSSHFSKSKEYVVVIDR